MSKRVILPLAAIVLAIIILALVFTNLNFNHSSSQTYFINYGSTQIEKTVSIGAERSDIISVPNAKDYALVMIVPKQLAKNESDIKFSYTGVKATISDDPIFRFRVLEGNIGVKAVYPSDSNYSSICLLLPLNFVLGLDENQKNYLYNSFRGLADLNMGIEEAKSAEVTLAEELSKNGVNVSLLGINKENNSLHFASPNSMVDGTINSVNNVKNKILGEREEKKRAEMESEFIKKLNVDISLNDPNNQRMAAPSVQVDLSSRPDALSELNKYKVNIRRVVLPSEIPKESVFAKYDMSKDYYFVEVTYIRDAKPGQVDKTRIQLFRKTSSAGGKDAAQNEGGVQNPSQTNNQTGNQAPSKQSNTFNPDGESLLSMGELVSMFSSLGDGKIYLDVYLENDTLPFVHLEKNEASGANQSKDYVHDTFRLASTFIIPIKFTGEAPSSLDNLVKENSWPDMIEVGVTSAMQSNSADVKLRYLDYPLAVDRNKNMNIYGVLSAPGVNYSAEPVNGLLITFRNNSMEPNDLLVSADYSKLYDSSKPLPQVVDKDIFVYYLVDGMFPVHVKVNINEPGVVIAPLKLKDAADYVSQIKGFTEILVDTYSSEGKALGQNEIATSAKAKLEELYSKNKFTYLLILGNDNEGYIPSQEGTLIPPETIYMGSSGIEESLFPVLDSLYFGRLNNSKYVNVSVARIPLDTSQQIIGYFKNEKTYTNLDASYIIYADDKATKIEAAQNRLTELEPDYESDAANQEREYLEERITELKTEKDKEGSDSGNDTPYGYFVLYGDPTIKYPVLSPTTILSENKVFVQKVINYDLFKLSMADSAEKYQKCDKSAMAIDNNYSNNWQVLFTTNDGRKIYSQKFDLLDKNSNIPIISTTALTANGIKSVALLHNSKANDKNYWIKSDGAGKYSVYVRESYFKSETAAPRASDVYSSKVAYKNDVNPNDAISINVSSKAFAYTPYTPKIIYSGGKDNSVNEGSGKIPLYVNPSSDEFANLAKNSELVLLNSHGCQFGFTSLLDSKNGLVDSKRLKTNQLFFALACTSASSIGKRSIAQGASAFFGCYETCRGGAFLSIENLKENASIGVSFRDLLNMKILRDNYHNEVEEPIVQAQDVNHSDEAKQDTQTTGAGSKPDTDDPIKFSIAVDFSSKKISNNPSDANAAMVKDFFYQPCYYDSAVTVYNIPGGNYYIHNGQQLVAVGGNYSGDLAAVDSVSFIAGTKKLTLTKELLAHYYDNLLGIPISAHIKAFLYENGALENGYVIELNEIPIGS